MHKLSLRLVVIVALAAAAIAQGWVPDGFRSSAETPQGQRAILGLPPEAIATLKLIQNGGPFPYRQDGTTFHNRERLLPDRPRGYYREYTVRTPGARDRGARRFVTGGDPPEVFYYTEDHYRSFRRIEVAPTRH
jgi:ribonuclease T1